MLSAAITHAHTLAVSLALGHFYSHKEWTKLVRRVDKARRSLVMLTTSAKVIWQQAASSRLHSPYTLHSSPPRKNNCPFRRTWVWTHIFIRRLMGSPDPSSQTVSRSSWPFFQTSRSLLTDRPTDRRNGHETRPVRIGRLCSVWRVLKIINF